MLRRNFAKSRFTDRELQALCKALEYTVADRARHPNKAARKRGRYVATISGRLPPFAALPCASLQRYTEFGSHSTKRPTRAHRNSRQAKARIFATLPTLNCSSFERTCERQLLVLVGFASLKAGGKPWFGPKARRWPVLRPRKAPQPVRKEAIEPDE